jgi:hypothetical protein
MNWTSAEKKLLFWVIHYLPYLFMDIDTFHYLETIRKFILMLPGVEEYSCFGTPAFRVNESLALRNEERDKWGKKNPAVYFVTEHYFNYPTVLIHLSKIEEKELNLFLLTAWKSRANKKQLKEFGEK